MTSQEIVRYVDYLGIHFLRDARDYAKAGHADAASLFTELAEAALAFMDKAAPRDDEEELVEAAG